MPFLRIFGVINQLLAVFGSKKCSSVWDSNLATKNAPSSAWIIYIAVLSAYVLTLCENYNFSSSSYQHYGFVFDQHMCVLIAFELSVAEDNIQYSRTKQELASSSTVPMECRDILRDPKFLINSTQFISVFHNPCIDDYYQQLQLLLHTVIF